MLTGIIQGRCNRQLQKKRESILNPFILLICHLSFGFYAFELDTEASYPFISGFRQPLNYQLIPKYGWTLIAKHEANTTNAGREE